MENAGLMEKPNSKLIIGAIDNNGEKYPPIHVMCGVCIYAVLRLAGFSARGLEVEHFCNCNDKFVDIDKRCGAFDIDLSRLSEVQQQEYQRLHDSGELDDSASELDQQELDEIELL